MTQGEKGNDSNKKDGLDVQLDSSFQSSFRSTSTHLKVYDPNTGAEAANSEASRGSVDQSGMPVNSSAGGAELVNANIQKDQNLRKQNERGRLGGIHIEPPAGRHAPHHSWLLGSHGGKKKPQAVRTRDGIQAKSAIDSATLAGLFSAGSAAVSAPPGAPPSTTPAPSAPPAAPPSPSGRIGEHPDDYRMPANAKGALPPENYEQPDLYAPTVEVPNPAAQASSKPDANEKTEAGADDAFDETVAHLYSRTVDVSKPGKLTRFPEESLSPSSESQPPLEAPKFGNTSPPGSIPSEASPPVVQGTPPQLAPAGAPGPALVPPSQPPKLPPPRPLSQFQSGISHQQYQSSSSNPVSPPKLPPNFPSPSAPSQLLSGAAYPAAKSQNEGPQSNKANWTPNFAASPPKDESGDSSESGPFPTVKKSPPVTATSEYSARKRIRSTRASSHQKETDTADDGNARGPRKRGLPSYIDRQIGSADEQEADEDDRNNRNDKKGGSAGKAIGIAVAAIIALAAVGAVAYQGINSGGSSWIPFMGSDEWKKLKTKAEAEMSDGKFDEAIESYSQAIKLNNGQAVLYHGRGFAKFQLHKRGQNESALRDFDLALKQDPKLFEAMLDRAAVRIELGQFEQAIEDYDRLIKAGKDTDKIRYGRGLAKYYAGEYAEAEHEFKNILKDNPDNSEAAIALGTTLYTSQSDKKAAEEQFTTAARNDHSGLADRNLGILSYGQGAAGYQAAKKFYSDAIDENQNDANLYNERGVISWLLKNPLDATADFRRAVGLDPDLDSAVRNLEFVGQSSVDADPKSEVALLSQIEINLLKKNWALAITNADKLIEGAGWKKAPAYEGVLLKWVALNLDGKPEKSQEVLSDCKDNAGSFPWPMPLVKYLSADEGKADFAKLEEESFNPTQRTAAHYYAGMNDYFNGNSEDAKKKLQWVIEQGSSSNPEYPLAGQALELLAAGTPKKSGVAK